jgi:hypothetical protein
MTELDPELVKYLSQFKPKSKDDDIAWMRTFVENPESYEYGKMKYDKTKGYEFLRLLNKYKADSFYLLTRWVKSPGANYLMKRYSFLTSEELIEMLPSGVDIDKVLISGKNLSELGREIGSKYSVDGRLEAFESQLDLNPTLYNSSSEVELFSYIRDNFQPVSTVLLAMAKHFYE